MLNALPRNIIRFVNVNEDLRVIRRFNASKVCIHITINDFL